MDRQVPDDVLPAAGDYRGGLHGVVFFLLVGGIRQTVAVVPADLQLQLADFVHEHLVVVASVILRIAVDRAVRQFDAVDVVDRDDAVAVADRRTPEQPLVGLIVVQAREVLLADQRRVGRERIGPDRLPQVDRDLQFRIVDPAQREERVIRDGPVRQVQIDRVSVAGNAGTGIIERHIVSHGPVRIEGLSAGRVQRQVTVHGEDPVDEPLAVQVDFGIRPPAQRDISFETGILHQVFLERVSLIGAGEPGHDAVADLEGPGAVEQAGSRAAVDGQLPAMIVVLVDQDVPGHRNVQSVDVFEQVVLHEERAVRVHARDDRRVVLLVVEYEAAVFLLVQGDDFAAGLDGQVAVERQFGVRDDAHVLHEEVGVMLPVDDESVQAFRIIDGPVLRVRVGHAQVFGVHSRGGNRQHDPLILHIVRQHVMVAVVVHLRVLGGQHLRVDAADVDREVIDQGSRIVRQDVGAGLLVVTEQQAEVRVFREGPELEQAAVVRGAVGEVRIDGMAVHIDDRV